MKAINRVAVMFLFLALAAASLAAAPAARKRSPYAGGWLATDITDGSDIRVIITPFNRVSYVDESFSACGGGEVRGAGRATMVGDTLIAGLRMMCTSTDVIIDRSYTLSFTPAAAGGELIDSNGNVYLLAKTFGCKRR